MFPVYEIESTPQTFCKKPIHAIPENFTIVHEVYLLRHFIVTCGECNGPSIFTFISEMPIIVCIAENKIATYV